MIENLIWTPDPADLEAEREWIKEEIKKVGIEKINALIQRAQEAREYAYPAYSNYFVGVSLLTVSGQTYTGINAERVTYSETTHSEQMAVDSAIIGGEVKKSGRKFITALAVVHTDDSAPCGRCRQIIAEHADNALIVVASPEGEIRRITSLKTIFPYAFTPTALGK